MNQTQSWIVFAAALVLSSTAALAGPANDDLINSTALTADSVTDSTAAATKETGEPNHALGQGQTASGKSVWYSWTAPSSGFAEFVLGGAFKKVLAIYTGTSFGNLTLAKNAYEISGYNAYGKLDVMAGTQYLIAVDGYAGSSGSFTLSVAVTPPPPNDAFADRVVLSGANASATGANIGACKEPGEPIHAGASGGHSVWWTWTAPASGRVTITVGGSFYKVFAIYTGTDLASLTVVASSNSSAALNFEAIGGQVYQIAVDGSGNYDFTSSLSVSVALQPPPVNDQFTSASVVTGTGATVNSATNISASMEVSEPNHAGRAGGHSVWWTWTAPEAGHFVVAVNGYFNKLLGIYTGDSVATLSEVARGYGLSGQPAQAGFNAVAGTVYAFAVDGEGGVADTFSLELMLPPLNDDFANRFTLTGAPLSATANTRTATKEAAEPNHAAETGGKSLWWTWTAPSAGRVVITTSGFDTAVAVYTGADLASLTAVASGVAYSPNPAYASFDALAGVTYQLAVDGKYGEGGSLTMNLAYVTAPAGDFFADRPPVVFPNPALPNTFYVTGSNLGATKETDEIWWGSASVWWAWTAPADGEVLIELETYGTTMAFPWLNLFSGSTLAGLTRISPRIEYAGQKNYHVARFTVTAGTSYSIWVANRAGLQGTYTLRGTFEAPPANDQFENRTLIENSEFLMQYGYIYQYGWNVCTTKETGEPWHGGATYTSHGGRSAWWSWTAPGNGRASFAVLPQRYVFSSLVGVYTGTAVNSLTRIANAYSTCTDGSAGVTFAITAGTTYQFAVDGDGTGEYKLSLDVKLDTTAPTVAITQPTTGQVLDSASLTVSGTASDPAAAGSINYSSGLNLVEVRVNGGAWLPASGTSTWSRALTLPEGLSLIEARGTDAVGNVSALASVAVTFGTVGTGASLIFDLRMVDGQPQLTFTSAVGSSYLFEWTPTLVEPVVWTPLEGGPIMGTGLPVIFTDPSAAGQLQRFYRLKVERN